MNTKKSRTIRKKVQELNYDNINMENTTKKSCRLQNQKDMVLKSNGSMKKIIELRYGEMKTDYNECDSYSWIEYGTVGFFDNINDCWNVINERTKKYHTRTDEYSIRVIELNQQSETLTQTFGEELKSREYQNKIELEKKELLHKKTSGFRCSECKKIIKATHASSEDSTKSYHAQTHAKGGSWSHVDFKRILKKGGGEYEV